MVTSRLRLLRLGVLLGMIAALVLVTTFASSPAIARPYTTDGSGDPSGTGDPTGDDLQSPTPKPNGRAAKWGGYGTAQGTAAQIRMHSEFGASSRLGLYFRILARLAIR